LERYAVREEVLFGLRRIPGELHLACHGSQIARSNVLVNGGSALTVELARRWWPVRSTLS
jgi:hypothetical protein